VRIVRCPPRQLRCMPVQNRRRRLPGRASQLASRFEMQVAMSSAVSWFVCHNCAADAVRDAQQVGAGGKGALRIPLRQSSASR
jgi:hypothetical protein